MQRAQDLHVQVHLEHGLLWATVDEYPGVFATGDNFQELRESLADGISLMIALPGEDAPHVELGDIEPRSSKPVSTTAKLVCA